MTLQAELRLKDLSLISFCYTHALCFPSCIQNDMSKFTASSESKKTQTYHSFQNWNSQEQQQRLITLWFWIRKRPNIFPNINQNGDEDTRLAHKFWQPKVCCWIASGWFAGAERKPHRAPVLPALSRTAISCIPAKGQSVLQGSCMSKWDFSRHLLHLTYFEKGLDFFQATLLTFWTN